MCNCVKTNKVQHSDGGSAAHGVGERLVHGAVVVHLGHPP